MYEVLSLGTKYILTTAVFYFIYQIIRLISFDINAFMHIEKDSIETPTLTLITSSEATHASGFENGYTLVQMRTIMGRSQNCDIQIHDPHVSSEHALIVKDHSDVYIEDLKSVNGTFINDNQLENRTKLASGDQIRVGNTIFELSMGNSQ